MSNSTPNSPNHVNQLTLDDIQARLETLEMLVSMTLDAMPPDSQIYELARLQKRLALLDDLPELKANILRAWLDVHETIEAQS